MTADMALAVHMDGCAARYMKSVDFRRKLERERPGPTKRAIQKRKAA